MFTLNGNYKWTDLLPRLMSNYNASKASNDRHAIHWCKW